MPGAVEVVPVRDAELNPGEPASRASSIELATSVGLVLVFIGFVVGSRTITDNSFLTHLATGQLILDTGSIPTADPYSLAAHGDPWTVQSWLVSVIYAGLDSTLGGWSIRLMNGMLGAAITVGLWRLTASVRQLLTRTMVVALALLIGTFLWPPRPLLFGLLAMVLVLEVAQDLRARWWLIPIFWFWVNAHGSFVLGLGVLGAIMVGAAIDNRRLPQDEVKTLAVAVVGCLLAAVNPVGPRLLWFPFHLMGRSEALERVSEWGSPGFRSPVEQLFLIPLVMIVIAASRQARWRALLPALVFFVSGLLAVRNLGLASIAVVALVAPSLADLGGSIDGSERGRLASVVAMVAAIGLAIASFAVMTGAPVELEDYPIAEIDWLEAHELVAQDDVRLVQRDYVGNYLTLRYGSEARVFMDDRFDFHPLDVIEDHNALLLGGDVDEVLDRRAFDVALWASDSHFHRWILAQDDWTIVMSDESWFVACRTTSALYQRCFD
ncbi:MAG: hypothetical protein GY724_03430 [Actinomycetia bacterium]|nr:hypothetical protein [Actinomycetes bacterium]MCP4223165.1 hypothetical protein [Actinomycetes bacterium]MCP5032831.1 hypothetical protein [Actinomycetes bacterium]